MERIFPTRNTLRLLLNLFVMSPAAHGIKAKMTKTAMLKMNMK